MLTKEDFIDFTGSTQSDIEFEEEVARVDAEEPLTFSMFVDDVTFRDLAAFALICMAMLVLCLWSFTEGVK